MSAYCKLAPGHPWHGPYHDAEYGFPLRDDCLLFERLALEINQAGLSWLTVLKKKDEFYRAYAGFNLDRVAAFGVTERQGLLANPGIIRNRMKIDAVINNARRLIEICATHGSFADWLDQHHPLTKTEWIALFKQNFRFTGPEITGEFLMSTGYLPGAHHPDCPVYAKILKLNPPWARET